MHEAEPLDPLETSIPPEAPHPPPPMLEHGADFHEWNLDEAPGGRFDEARPIQLETRGITQDPPSLTERNRLPHLQPEFWSAATIHKNTVAAKLRQAGQLTRAEDLEFCHSTFTVGLCMDCGSHRAFPNRCDRFYCPECQPRLAYERKRSVEWWTHEVHQPKHVVLTVRNVWDLTKGHVQELKKWFTNLRNRKFARNWRGGFYSLEITNEGKGWHLHIHALVDAKWIDAPELARQWNSVTNNSGNIVKVKDCRQSDYLAEVTKYAVKGSQLSAWTPDQIVTLIEALDGVRCFGVFGSLYGKRTEFQEWLESIRDQKPRCPCGSCNVKYFTEHDFAMLDLQPNDTHTKTRPPPPREAQTELSLPISHQWHH
jgi:hypothetical protein